MSEKHNKVTGLSRRDVLAAAGGAVGTTALSGVVSAEQAGSDLEPREGGTFTVGWDNSTDQISPYSSNTSLNGVLIRQIYDKGVVIDRDSSSVRPWLFTDWSLSHEDGEQPTVDVTVREDVTWHDGEPFTAADAVFTYRYVQAHPDNGQVISTGLQYLDSVEQIGTYQFRITLTEPYSTWRQTLLRVTVLPKHIWAAVDNPAQRQPVAEGGPIGTGAFTVDSFDPDADTFVRLVPRENSAETYPMPGEIEFLAENPPYVDAFEIRKYDSSEAITEALASGEVDAANTSLNYEQTVAYRENNCRVNVIESEEDGFSLAGFNTRRVPFDDVVFRQFLHRLWDDEYFIDDVHNGVDATAGDYLAPLSFDAYRPAGPDDPKSEQFTLFRDDAGAFDPEAAKAFLVDNPDTKHEYTFEETADGTRLYVNGDPLGAAHTDNSGSGDQGPIELAFTPARYNPERVKGIARWREHLATLGIPTTTTEIGLSPLISKVFGQQAFDVYFIGWTDLNPSVSYLDVIAGDNPSGNPTGYSGANDQIRAAETALDPSARTDAVQTALQTIYEDCPYMVTKYARLYQPLLEDWAGWVNDQGGIYNQFTWLNIHRPPEIDLRIRGQSADDRPPKVNSRSKGRIQVIVPATDSFDPVNELDIETLQFGASSAVNQCAGASPVKSQAVNRSGSANDDLMLQFEMEETGFDSGDTTAKLAGRSDGGTPIAATAEVQVT